MKKEENKETKKDTVTKNKKTTSYYESVGRRREATARVRLYVVDEDSVNVNQIEMKKGDIYVNTRKVDNYFPGKEYKKVYLEPLRTTNTINRFAVSIKVSGGGLVGQLGAVVHGLARALEKVDKDRFRPILKKRGFLTRDPRAKERRKAGLAQKARAKKQSPKR